jgi:hypothetical protein
VKEVRVATREEAQAEADRLSKAAIKAAVKGDADRARALSEEGAAGSAPLEGQALKVLLS